MSHLPQLIYDGTLVAGVATLLYAGTVTTTALTAVFAPTKQRRRNARKVLRLLLCQRSH
jgi:hypothetical protein